MPKTNTDAQKGNKQSRRPYEKPCLKAVDLYADEIMGGCKDAPPCTQPPGSGGTGPVSGEG